MRKMLGGLSLLTVFLVSAFAAPLHADTTTKKPFKRAVTAPLYDVAKEVTLEGTIQSVVKKPTSGMMLGAHLMVSTPKGVVDAHIGGFVLKGQHPYAPAAGESVKILGVMATINHKQVFLTRTIDTGGRTIQVRTEHGFLITPGAHGRMLSTSLKESTKEGAR
jgi:hypothetical protein